MLRAVTVITMVGALAAACSQSPSGRGDAGATNLGSSPGGSASASPLALARCMRAHGVHDYPDPNSRGNFDLSGEGDLTPNNPTFQAAAQACRSLGSATKGSAPSLTPQQIAATVAFAHCMRNHGITNYPDPQQQRSNPRHPPFRNRSQQPPVPLRDRCLRALHARHARLVVVTRITSTRTRTSAATYREHPVVVGLVPTPSLLIVIASRTQTVWRCRSVPTLSGQLPPIPPLLPGSGSVEPGAFVDVPSLSVLRSVPAPWACPAVAVGSGEACRS